ncbi:SpoIIE family protein phosphatase [Streptomyces sp. GMY02]|uniref:PP2C family protein-serine/threonine phosphatase n=1 Tax=Streptomyces sp. GMY02 TaxID=1333528 RepID=UPI001C2CA7ED|nr:SpoIIE family protein phosphatase [Streptomyces sp. GMY02]QXE36779.1 SpoIIE family protein phosphatase [Streptomyces sp. GMY02]
MVGQVLRDGKPIIDHEFPLVSGYGEDRVISLSLWKIDAVDSIDALDSMDSADAVVGTAGSGIGVCMTLTDVTRSRARRRLALLSEASRRIGTTLDVMTTAQELADMAVPLLADYATVDLADAVPIGETPPLNRLEPVRARIPVFRRAGVASIHPGLPESTFALGEAVYVPRPSPFLNALESGRSHFEPVLDTSRGTWLDKDPIRAKVINRTRMHSVMMVPLKTSDEVLGIAVFVRNDNPVPFSRDDLLFAEELVLRASLHVYKAHLYTRERSAMLALQRNLLPHDLYGGPMVEVASHYLPSDMHEGVGGDWYDVIRLTGGRVALVIGDVVGHGIGAAATMGQMRTAVHTLATLDLPPDELLTRLDALAVRLSNENENADGFNGTVVASCLYAVYDPSRKIWSMARAGHPAPMVRTPSGEVALVDVPGGTGIGYGLSPYEPYESIDVGLPEGSIVALYTDGLIETRNADIDMGLGRLRKALMAPVSDLAELCHHTVDTMIGPKAPSDDVALLLARTGPR